MGYVGEICCGRCAGDIAGDRHPQETLREFFEVFGQMSGVEGAPLTLSISLTLTLSLPLPLPLPLPLTLSLSLTLHQAAANLVASSITEDALGTVGLSNSLESVLGSLLDCLQALESYAGTGAAVGATAAMAGGGATRGRRLLQPHSQQAALLVAQSTASQVRSHTVHKVAALEAALQRSVQLLASSYRAHLRGLRLAPERHAKIEQLLGATL